MIKIQDKTIETYVLKNAIKYKGKANQGAVLAALFAEGLEKSEIPKYISKINSIIKEINSLSLEFQREKLTKSNFQTSKREVREGLKELPNAQIGKVVMRMAPFPSGPLHIGNARAFILNDEYCKMYKGKLVLVFDDTIGSETKRIESESYKLIENGIQWLNINYEKEIIYKSNRNEKYYTYAEEMLKKGYLYICNCKQEEMRKLKTKGVECSCRNLPPEKHILRWEEMFKVKEGSMCARLKTNMQDPDPAFRDRVMFKISDRSHAKTKNKFRVYPTMDFAWGIDDHLLGVTHVLRGTDHHLSTRVQDFIRKIFNWQNPESIYNGKFAIEGIIISKSQSTQKIKSGKYIGWNDPRTWSLQSLHDRGINPEAIREFILSLGIRKTNIITPIETLYSINKKLLENVPRYFFVEEPKKITIKGCPELIAEIPFHPNNTLGKRKYATTSTFLISKQDYSSMQNENYRLMHLLNFKADQVKLGTKDLSFISTEPNPKLKTTFIQWLSYNSSNINVEILMSDGNIIKGKGEPKLDKLKTGTIIQFERFGFVKLNKKSKDKLEFWFTHK